MDVYFVLVFFVDVAKKARPVMREKRENILQVSWYPNCPAVVPPTKIPTALPIPKYPDPKSPYKHRFEIISFISKIKYWMS